MIKILFTAALAVLTANSYAVPVTDPAQLLVNTVSAQIPMDTLLLWKVGDTANYKLDGGFIQGTLHMFVREETTQGFWIQQDMDMGFLGKQKVEVHYDKSNGAVLEMIVNDQKQTPPDPNDIEIVETKHDHIKVPAGEWDCVYVKLHDKKQNTDADLWVNPKIVPIAGMLKQIAQSQMGPITIELTDFQRM